MRYIPEAMDDKRTEIERLKGRVEELERLADGLNEVPDGDLSGELDRAVELLEEINAGIETGLDTAESETAEAGRSLDEVGFGPFDAALADIERGEDSGGEPDERG